MHGALPGIWVDSRLAICSCSYYAQDLFGFSAQYSGTVIAALISLFFVITEATILCKSVCRFVSLAVVALSFQLPAKAQSENKSAGKPPAKSSRATCFDESSGKLVGPAKARTFVLSSPDGNYRAYAETEAVTRKVTTDAGEQLECENTSTLFVAGPGGQKYRPVLVLPPSPELLGNSIDLIDWSPVGHRLLIGQGLWQYGSDFGATIVQTYDADSETLSNKFLVDDAFSKYAGKQCVSVFQPAGFALNGEVIVTAGPYFDVGEDQPRGDSCIPKEGLWQVDLAGRTVTSLPANYKIQRFGKTIDGPGTQ